MSTSLRFRAKNEHGPTFYLVVGPGGDVTLMTTDRTLVTLSYVFSDAASVSFALEDIYDNCAHQISPRSSCEERMLALLREAAPQFQWSPVVSVV